MLFQKKILLLSHGQATTEHSFSTNKEVIHSYLSEMSTICRRRIKDNINMVGGIENVFLTDELITKGLQAHSRYVAYLSGEKSKN